MVGIRVPSFGPRRPVPADHLSWHRTSVGGRAAFYGVAGDGLPVLFLHGWALGQHTYKRALKRLVPLGCKVYAPAMPGFGGTADLPAGSHDLAGYARWVAEFLDTVGVEEPAFVIGHSFGGAVATQLAHDFGSKVGHLVLVNAIGGPAWRQSGATVRSMSERPLWDWGVNFPADLFPLSGLVHRLSVILEDAVPNLVGNPIGMWRAAQVARNADLTAELNDLRARGLPVVVLWGDKDTVIPRASFDAVCAAVGSVGKVVPGRHSWLLADPDAFGEVMANSVVVARTARQLAQSSAHRPS
jgi:pimeloyl-ACP methyl ester carboxylesterase